MPPFIHRRISVGSSKLRPYLNILIPASSPRLAYRNASILEIFRGTRLIAKGVALRQIIESDAFVDSDCETLEVVGGRGAHKSGRISSSFPFAASGSRARRKKRNFQRGGTVRIFRRFRVQLGSKDIYATIGSRGQASTYTYLRITLRRLHCPCRWLLRSEVHQGSDDARTHRHASYVRSSANHLSHSLDPLRLAALLLFSHTPFRQRCRASRSLLATLSPSHFRISYYLSAECTFHSRDLFAALPLCRFAALLFPNTVPASLRSFDHRNICSVDEVNAKVACLRVLDGREREIPSGRGTLLQERRTKRGCPFRFGIRGSGTIFSQSIAACCSYALSVSIQIRIVYSSSSLPLLQRPPACHSSPTLSPFPFALPCVVPLVQKSARSPARPHCAILVSLSPFTIPLGDSLSHLNLSILLHSTFYVTRSPFSLSLCPCNVLSLAHLCPS